LRVGGDGSCRGQRDEFAVHEEAFEPAFVASGSQLEVRPLLVVDVEGLKSAPRAGLAFHLIQYLPSNVEAGVNIYLRAECN